ncbi:hypothetical protein ILYODFUR_020968, partial [Ilyodon furcidens]
GRGGAGAYLQESKSEWWGTPWTGRQSITGQHRDAKDKQPCTPKGNLESHPCMHRENMQTPCRKTPGQESNPGPSCCQATVLPTVPLCSHYTDYRFLKTQFMNCKTFCKTNYYFNLILFS